MGVINFAGDAWVARTDEEPVEEDVLRIAAAVGMVARENHPGANVYVGYDTRPLSQALACEVGEVIAAYGLHVLVSDTHCPLAALCEATRRDPSAFAAVMLTADCRPADYMGVRVRMGDGSAMTPSDADVLESLIEPEVPSARGEVERVDLMTAYLERIFAFVGEGALAQARPLVVCDPMHGAATSHAARLLASLGARTIELHDDGDPDFGGLHPEVVEPWIDELELAVCEHNAALGLAIDGSAGRIALIDETGTLVTPHMMIALVMEYLVRRRSLTGRMVAPIFVSTIVRRQAARLGMPLTVTPAGYLWMREEMGAGDVLCAGDALGGVCLPALGLERDAVACAAVLCELVAADGRPLSEMVAELDGELGHMEYGRRDVRMGSGAVQVLRSVLPGVNPQTVAGMRPCEVSHPGGLMLRFENGSWLLVRPSRAYALARVYAEAPTRAARDELLSAGSEIALSPLSA